MPLLKDRFQRFPKLLRIILLILPIFFSGALIYYFLIIPKSAEVEKLKRDIKTVENDLNRNRQLLQTMTPLSEKEKKDISNTKQALSSIVEGLGPTNEIYNRLTARATSCNILDVSLDPTYIPTEGAVPGGESILGLAGYRSFAKVSFHSSFRDLACFLEGISGTKKDVIIESMTIEREHPIPSAVLVLKFFTKETR
ncbi:MAG TPA: hypothetical protein ACFYD1_06495 [Candidatus Hypogeohydataceae bacterium YC38]